MSQVNIFDRKVANCSQLSGLKRRIFYTFFVCLCDNRLWKTWPDLTVRWGYTAKDESKKHEEHVGQEVWELLLNCSELWRASFCICRLLHGILTFLWEISWNQKSFPSCGVLFNFQGPLSKKDGLLICKSDYSTFLILLVIWKLILQISIFDLKKKENSRSVGTDLLYA